MCLKDPGWDLAWGSHFLLFLDVQDEGLQNPHATSESCQTMPSPSAAHFNTPKHIRLWFKYYLRAYSDHVASLAHIRRFTPILDWYIGEYMISIHNIYNSIKEPTQPVLRL